MLHRSAGRLTSALLVTWLGACSGEDAASSSANGLGALALQVTLPEADVGDLEYSVTREGAIKRTGTFIVDGYRGTFRAVLGALPQADDYRLELTGGAREIDTREEIECSGFAAFGVTRDQTTGISLRLYCGEERPPTPGTSDPPEDEPAGHEDCPEVEVIHATPEVAAVGSEIKLMAEVTHLDRVPAVIYAWSSDAGTFTQAISGQATYKCTQLGEANITLDISFSDGDKTCPKQSGSVEVQCSAAMQAAAGRSGESR